MSASVFMDLTPNVVRYACTGLRRDASLKGGARREFNVFAKVSRPEVAAQFMQAAPKAMLDNLVAEGQLTRESADLALDVPVATDTSQLLALIVARQVLEDATRSQFERLNRDRVSVILGVASATELLGSMVSRLQRPVWAKALRESGIPEKEITGICDRIAANYVPWQESTFPGLLGNVVAGRIANRFNLGGTNSVVDAACASSLAALAMAANELHLGQSDLCIVGGVDTLNDILMYMCFSKTPAFSQSGDCRPFSSKADGTFLGEGISMLELLRACAVGDRRFQRLRPSRQA